MTKITVLNPPVKKEEKLKKIEFIKFISFDGKTLINPEVHPSEFDSINVLLQETGMDYDLFICRSGNHNYVYTGYYNDGIV